MIKTEKPLHIARIATVPEAFVHIKAFLRFLKSKDTQVSLISSHGKYEITLKDELGLAITPLQIEREINLVKDLAALAQLILLFRTQKFSLVHSSTPKAGLLVALAGLFSPSTVRIHTFTGQRWATLDGFKRGLLKKLDRLIIILNHQCYADSASQISFLQQQGVAKPGEVVCIHKGSYGGIDIDRFDKNKYPTARADLIRQLNVPDDSFLLLFMGRVTRDKGIEELVDAFAKAASKNKKLKLVLVGPYEPQLDPLSENCRRIISEHAAIFSLGFQSDPQRYFSATDLLCLPSYREGFGTVVLEAASCGLPTIGTRIPGLVDSVVDGETGLLVELKNREALSEAILNLSLDAHKLATLSENAKARARTDFNSTLLAQLQWDEYLRLLKKQRE